MVTDKGKKQKVGEEVGEEENTELQIDGDLIISIEKLQEVQDELEKISEEASDKVLEIEQKYNEVRKPIYDKRNDIIKAIPEFWTTAFLSHPALGELVSEEDQKIFKYLSSLEVEDFKDVKSGYSISFNFNRNPFFEDSKLTKTFTFLDEGTTKVTSTSIKWKDGMGLPNGVADDKKGNKRPHAADESFFSWFGETQKDEMDEVNDEIAEIIKEDLWPNPLTYFNNDADEMDFEGVEGVGEENGSDDEDDSDEDDEEGDDDDEGN